MGALIQLDIQKPAKPMRGYKDHTGQQVQGDLPQVGGQIQPHLLGTAQAGLEQMLLCHKQAGHRLKGQHGAAIAGCCRVGGKEPEQRPPQTDADRHHPKRIHQQDPPPFSQALFYTARLEGRLCFAQ